jgi:D-sedoheptulose 7-phosphate isomerase
MQNEFNENVEIELLILKDIIHKQEFLESKEIKNLLKGIHEIVSCFKRRNKLLIFGNGGSAADAQHIAGELVGRFSLERKPLPVIALTTDTSVITAWANDYDYSTIFERQVEGLAKKGDVLLGISTSGNSENVIKALKKGKKIGTKNISLTGRNGGNVKLQSHINISYPSQNTPAIQEGHSLIYHILCNRIERELFNKIKIKKVKNEKKKKTNRK